MGENTPIRPPSLLRILALCLLFLAGAPTLAAQPAPGTPRALSRAIDSVLDQEALANAFCGVAVVDLDRRETIYAHNEHKSLVPASNVKLYTAAAVLDLLGPDYRYRTRLYTDGPVVDGTLQGNLIVRGAGDPSLGSTYPEDYREEDPAAVFRAWADSLRAHGVTHVDGDLIGDDDVFDDLPLGYGWSWDDEPYYYSAEIGGLTFSDNTVEFEIEAQRVGMPGLVRWHPLGTDYVEVTNSTLTLPADSALDEGYARVRGTNRFRLFSQIPVGRTDRESLSVHNPTLFFTHVLRETLLREGIAVAGRPVDVDDLPIKPNYAGLRRLAVAPSPPLAELVKIMNTESQNLYAEQLLRTLAAWRPVEDEELEPGSAEMGLEVAMETFARAGVDTSRIQLADGSGLSRHNLVTASMTADLLEYMYYHPRLSIREAFYESLPIGGSDGTLQYRFTYGPTRGNVRAKTGTLSNASALSGYVTSAAGTPLAFSVMCNHYTVRTGEVRRVQDAVVDLLSRYRD